MAASPNRQTPQTLTAPARRPWPVPARAACCRAATHTPTTPCTPPKITAPNSPQSTEIDTISNPQAMAGAGLGGVLLGGNYVAGVALGRCVEYGYEFAGQVADYVQAQKAGAPAAKREAVAGKA